MFLDDLVPSLQASLNGPDGSLFSDTDTSGYVSALTNAFWTARLRGFFPEYRVADDEIVNVEDPDVEIPRELAQVIVVFAAMNAIESKILGLPTKKRSKAGPVESETQRSAAVLVELLKQKRAELEAIRDDTVAGNPAIAGFADLALSRLPVWVR